MVWLFGEWQNIYVVFGIMFLATFCLFFLRLHILLLFTLIALLLTSLDTPLRADARILRWAFLAALLVKGLAGAGGGLLPNPLSRAHHFIGALETAPVEAKAVERLVYSWRQHECLLHPRVDNLIGRGVFRPGPGGYGGHESGNFRDCKFGRVHNTVIAVSLDL